MMLTQRPEHRGSRADYESNSALRNRSFWAVLDQAEPALGWENRLGVSICLPQESRLPLLPRHPRRELDSATRPARMLSARGERRPLGPRPTKSTLDPTYNESSII